MKYMTFNSSCSYAGVANMLAQYGVDTDDRTIAQKMMLPYLFAEEDGAYHSGPMLQSARWFNLYLYPIGYTMIENKVDRNQVPVALHNKKAAMLGLHVSPKSKHAVVYQGMNHGKYRFLNNKWQHTDEPEQLFLDEAELLARLDDSVVIATVEPAPCREVDFKPLLKQSVRVLNDLKRDIQEFCRSEQSPKAITAAMNTLFRAILLDGITMLELSNQTALAEKLRIVQKEFMAAIKKKTTVKLSEEISVSVLMEAIEEYQQLIQQY
ncbi:MAG: hypothetical protein IKC03_06440 [Oscillospiraceae bacterium]|nr:hypothetical protein [Oscillospiraceae bacterium]